jgi:hypothetical protein
VGRFFLSTLEAVRRIALAEREEPALAEGGNTIGFDTGRGGRGGSSALWAGANGEDGDFEPGRLLVHQLTLLVFLLASCSPSDLYASSPSASNSLPGYVRNETFTKLCAVLHLLRPNCTPKFVRKALRTSYFLSKCIIGSAWNGLMCRGRESGLV